MKISGHEYFQFQDQKMSGTGIWEHKGGIIASIAALQSLRFIRILRKMKVGLLFTTDDQSLVIAPYKSSMDTNIMQPYAHGEVQLSVRYNQKEQFEEVDAKLKKMIPRKKYSESIQFQMDGGMSRDPLIDSEKTIEFYNLVKGLSKNLDIRVTKEHRWSSSDICFADPGAYILDGFGPIGQKTQDKSEYVLRHSLLERALLIAINT